MSEVIRAIYEEGNLRPLDPVSLADGQEIRLAILSERDQVRQALGDLLAPVSAQSSAGIDEAELMKIMDTDLRNNVSISDAIVAERREGP
jgi:predicted DNA-binding antitoxin AbrB/MazE fold protein